MINSCFEALGAIPIEEFLPSEQDLQLMQTQADLGLMNFLQGRIHKQISTEIGTMGLCTLTKPLAIQRQSGALTTKHYTEPQKQNTPTNIRPNLIKKYSTF